MTILIRRNLPFLIPYFLFEIIGFFWVSDLPKVEQMIYINAFVNERSFYFFKFLSDLAEGWIWGLLIVFMLFYRIRWAIKAILSVIISTSFVSFLKFQVFAEDLKPYTYFKNSGIHWHFLHNIFMNEYNGFSSDHSTSAFASLALVAIFCKNKFWGFPLCILAVLIGFSRCYLFQHFPEDVLAGAAIGTSISFLTFAIVRKFTKI